VDERLTLLIEVPRIRAIGAWHFDPDKSSLAG
jgi:hypothetical protein